MAKRRRRWEEELEREPESAGPKLAALDTGQRASVLEELQRASGNRALQQVVGAQRLQREAAPEVAGPAAYSEHEKRTFMIVDGIRGPAKDPSHVGQFEVESFDQEVTSPTDVHSGQASGRRQYSDVTVVIRKSISTPAFRQALAENKVIKEITIVTPIEGGFEVTKLTGVRVTGIKELQGGRVQLRFSPSKIEWETTGVGEGSGKGQTYDDEPHGPKS
jgi:type VI protein secretion system component Hcp